MEPPAKRVKIADPEIRDPRDSGSRRTEGLFTSELGMRSDEADHRAQPTRTISLSDFQRQRVFGDYQHAPRPVLPRRNAGIYLLPRAPDATVTATVVQVNVNDGTSIMKATEVPVATNGAVVSLTDLGDITSAVSLTIPGLSNSTTANGDGTGSQHSTDFATISTTHGSSTINSSASTTSYFSTPSSINGTITTSSAEGRTVTVTATSIYEVSLINGTFIATEPATETTSDSITHSSSLIHTYTFGDISSTSSTDSFTTSYFSGAGSALATPTAGSGASGANSPTSTSDAAATSSSSSDSGGGGGGTTLTPVQQQVVGGVVGGVAGAALVLAIVLFVLRWYRRRLKARGELPEQIAARELVGGDGGEAYPMSQRSSTTPFAAAVTHGLRRLRPHSGATFGTNATAATESSVPESERGFQRIAGRKLAPVLSSGGDQYGGNYGAFEKETSAAGPSAPVDMPERGLSGASFYQDNRGFYGGKGTSTPTNMPASPTMPANRPTGAAAGYASSQRDFAAQPRNGSARNSSQASLAAPGRPEGFAIMRASPARTPVTLSPAASSIRLPIHQPPSMDPNTPPMPVLPMHDAVGRTLASQDGSRVSRSSGRSVGRFVENV